MGLRIKNLHQVWGHDSLCDYILLKGDSLYQFILLVEVVIIRSQAPDLKFKMNQFPCTEVKEKFLDSAKVYELHFIIRINKSYHINN